MRKAFALLLVFYIEEWRIFLIVSLVLFIAYFSRCIYKYGLPYLGKVSEIRFSNHSTNDWNMFEVEEVQRDLHCVVCMYVAIMKVESGNNEYM